MKVTIVGVRAFESKGRMAYEYYGLKDFTNYDIENSDCFGHSVVSEFTYTDFKLQVGDVVEFDYEPGFQGRARLVGIRPISLVESQEPSSSADNKPAGSDDKNPAGTDVKNPAGSDVKKPAVPDVDKTAAK